MQKCEKKPKTVQCLIGINHNCFQETFNLDKSLLAQQALTQKMFDCKVGSNLCNRLGDPQNNHLGKGIRDQGEFMLGQVKLGQVPARMPASTVFWDFLTKRPKDGDILQLQNVFRVKIFWSFGGKNPKYFDPKAGFWAGLTV